MRQRIHELENALQEIDASLDRKPDLESNISKKLLQGTRTMDKKPEKEHESPGTQARDAYLTDLADDLAELTLEGLEEAGSIGRQSITVSMRSWLYLQSFFDRIFAPTHNPYST